MAVAQPICPEETPGEVWHAYAHVWETCGLVAVMCTMLLSQVAGNIKLHFYKGWKLALLSIQKLYSEATD